MIPSSSQSSASVDRVRKLRPGKFKRAFKPGINPLVWEVLLADFNAGQSDTKETPMPRINYMISKHVIHANLAPHARAYMPRINDYDNWRVGQLGLAMSWIADAVINTFPVGQTCDEAFQLLPGKRAFRDLWNDPNIWISFHRDPDPTLHAQAVPGGSDIAIAYGAFRRGWMMVAATLIHEFVHINGHTARDRTAEDMLFPCGMGLRGVHDSTVVGYLQTMPRNAVRLA